MDETGRLGLDISWLHWKFKRIDIRLKRLSWQEVCLCGKASVIIIQYFIIIRQIYVCLSSLEPLLHNQFNNLKGLTYIRYYDFVILPTLPYQWGKIAITLTGNHLKGKHKCLQWHLYSKAKLHHYRGLQKWPTFSVQYLSPIYLHKTQVTQPQKPVSGSGYSWQSL